MMMMKGKFYILTALALVILGTQPVQAQVCDCLTTGNCPVPIQDNGTFQGTLDVTVNGSNDLGQCPLQSVCFSITHTWVGDLCVTLTSPSGLNYMVMADANNGFTGCGTSSDNIDVCVAIGTGNPLTNNTEYICNTGPCQSGSCCLVGNWTMPCGGVSDPVTGAQQAPNCDLNDFNVPGNPANGTWTLTVNDICGSDVGTLNNFTLNFACGASCVSCAANGGTITNPDLQACLGDPALNLSIIPLYTGGNQAPNPNEYGYAWVIAMNGMIQAVNPTPSMTSFPPGSYTVCGFSYVNTAAGLLNTLIGQDLGTMQAAFNSSTAPFCGDFSDDCMNVTIGPPIPPTTLDTALCIGDCIMVGFQPVCASTTVTLQSYLGCDSVINVIITQIPPVTTVQTVTVCQGECITVNNQQYCPPGPAVFTLPNWQGCDSTVTILFDEIITIAVINPSTPPPISCSDPAVVLDALSSFPPGVSYHWNGPNSFFSDQAFVAVNTPGVYTLVVTNSNQIPACTSETSVTIIGTVVPPELQLNGSPPVICEGESFDLSTLNIIDLNGTNPDLTFHTGTPATTANQLGNTIVSPTSTTTYYVKGTVGGCFDELAITVTVTPNPVAAFTVTSPICLNGSSTVTFTGQAPTGAVYSWNFGGGTATPGTGSGPHTVNWGSGGTKTITLVVTANGCTSNTATQTVEVGTQIPAPVINCISTSNSITFYWDPINGVNNYNVTVVSGPTGTQIDPTTYLISGLLPNQQVTISVEAVSPNACPNSSSQLTCSAQDCLPVIVSVNPVPDICLNASTGSVQLVATQTGGNGTGTFTWSGPGVAPITGVFNPANANPGANTIVATYEEGTCIYNASIVIVVNPEPLPDFTLTTPICIVDPATVNYTGNASNAATFTWDFGGGTANPGTGPGPHAVTWSAPGTYTVSLMVAENGCQSGSSTQTVAVGETLDEPQVTCNTTTNSVEFIWNNVPGANGYDVIVVTGPTGSTMPTDTSILFTGLNPGDAVTVQVTAFDAGPCNDVTIQQTCIAQDCPPVIIDIDPVAGICLDANTSPITLQATVSGGSGGGSMTWSGTGVSPSGVFDPTQATVGANTITASYQEVDCIYTEDIVINVLAQPIADFTANGPVCINDDVSVSYTGTVQPGIQFNWDFGTGAASPGTGQGPHLVSWDNSGSQAISLTVTTAQGCVSEPFFANVQVDEPLVAPVITCNTTINSIEFNWPDVSGATDYQVTQLAGSPGSQTSQNAYLVSGLLPSDQVTIELTISNTGACPPVTVQQTCIAQDCLPIVVSIDPVAPICIGTVASVQLTATITGAAGGGTGTWSGPGVSAAGVFDPATAGVGTHQVTFVYVENNCTYTTTGTIQVLPVPLANFNATDVICVADAATVTYTGGASANVGYTWDFGGGTATPGTGQGPHQVSFPAPGNYDITLTVSQNGCASVQATESVQVDPELIAPDIDCNTTNNSIEFFWDAVANANDYEVVVLSGSSGTLNSQTSYLVNGLQPNDAVTILLTVSGNTACPPVTAQETCIALECPTVTISLPPVDPICLGSTVGTMQLTATVTGGSGTTGTWSGPGITPSGSFDPAIAGVGNHTITFTYVENSSCSYDQSIQIEIVAPPVADAGIDGELSCKEDQTTYELGGNGSSTGANITYGWTAASGNFPGDANILHPVVAVADTYTLTVTNTAYQNCFDTDVVEVVASQDIPQPVVTITPISCFGEDDGAISVASVTGGEPPYLYSINGGEYSSVNNFTPLAPGVYTISVIDASGCEASLTIDMTQPQELNVELVAIIEGGGNIIRLGDTTELQALITLPPDSLDNISWSPSSLVSCDTCLNTFVAPTSQTIFTVTVESNGCTDSDDLTLYVKKERPIYVPNAFSPNGDGINDVFRIYAGEQVASIKAFLVFDRWGETVHQYFKFDPNDPDGDWNGTYRGETLNPAVFTWFAVVEFIDGVEELYEGSVTLVK